MLDRFLLASRSVEVGVRFEPAVPRELWPEGTCQAARVVVKTNRARCDSFGNENDLTQVQ